MQKMLLLVVTLFLSAYVIAQQSNKFTSHAQIEFIETVYNFDTINQGEEALCWFNFTNKGAEPLLITSAFSSCGCTIPEWPKEPIPPKGKGKIKVWYNTSKMGNFTKVIVVKSNSATDGKAILRIKGVVKEKMQDVLCTERINVIK